MAILQSTHHWAAGRRRWIALILVTAALAECASVDIHPSQTIEIVASDAAGVPLSAVNCTLRNDKGEWQLQVPGTIQVLRSSEPLHFECIAAEGSPALQGDIAATDQRGDRAKKTARRYGVAGAVAVPVFLGGPLAPAALVYMAVTGALAGGIGAAGRAAADTVTDSGFVYPEKVELREGGVNPE